MNKLVRFFIALGMAGIPAFAQLTTTSTTLVGAVPANSISQVCVASATGIQLTSVSQAASYLVVDKEALQITGQGSSSTCFQVKRGQLGSSGNYAHANGAKVWVGTAAAGSGDSSRPFTGGVITPNIPSGTCVASAQYSLPIVIAGSSNNPLAGATFYCIAGYWSGGQGASQPLNPFTSFTTLSPPNPIATTSVTDVAGKIWWSQIYADNNATLTGACVLNGATVGTDKWIFALYDPSGVALATTAIAGVTTATASKYQCIAFIAPVTVTGPSSYYIAVQGNGTTDNFQSYATASAPTNYGTGSQTGVFGTLANITPGTTFVAANGPLMMLY